MAAKKTTGRKRSGGRKTSARKSTGRRRTTARKSTGRKSTARRSTGRKKSTGRRKSTGRKKSTGRRKSATFRIASGSIRIEPRTLCSASTACGASLSMLMEGGLVLEVPHSPPTRAATPCNARACRPRGRPVLPHCGTTCPQPAKFVGDNHPDPVDSRRRCQSRTCPRQLGCRDPYRPNPPAAGANHRPGSRHRAARRPAHRQRSEGPMSPPTDARAGLRSRRVPTPGRRSPSSGRPARA